MSTTTPDTTAPLAPEAPSWLDKFNGWLLRAPLRLARFAFRHGKAGVEWVVDTVRAWPRAGIVAWWLIWAFAPIPRFEASWGWYNIALVASWPITFELVILARDQWRARYWVEEDPETVSDPQAVWGSMSRPRVGAQ